MSIWEIDFYRRPLRDELGHPLWELVICDPTGRFRSTAFCPQPDATAEWLILQLQKLLAATHPQPVALHVFRPQTLNLLQPIATRLGLAIHPTRQTPELKQYLVELAKDYPNQPGYINQPYDAIALDQPPPIPLANQLWGQKWRFAALNAADLVVAFTGRMMPILHMPESRLPIKLGLASTLPVPGVIIDGGRQSMSLARWIEQVGPVALKYLPGAPDGLILEAGLVDRWVMATFEDPDMVQAGQNYEKRKQHSQGLHFLLVQPDDSGMTHSGFWLLKDNP